MGEVYGTGMGPVLVSLSTQKSGVCVCDPRAEGLRCRDRWIQLAVQPS